MRAMDEEILETQKDTEKELREELDKACGKISEVIRNISQVLIFSWIFR